MFHMVLFLHCRTRVLLCENQPISVTPAANTHTIIRKPLELQLLRHSPISGSGEASLDPTVVRPFYESNNIK